ncbi:MAG: hypothetical protein ACREDO_10270 [Methyloceanibacter sp.]
MSATGDLIITNGDVAGELLRRALPGAEVLPWRDVLHDGPVPLTPNLEDLTAIRAEYLAGAGGGELGAIIYELTSRDRGIAYSASFDRAALWFEHDLYDQLQLLQVLDWFAANPRNDQSLLLVQAENYIGRETLETIAELARSEIPVSQEQLDLAQNAWLAFRQATPEPWTQLLQEDLSALPFLRQAVLRMLEELPGPDGLSRTERQLLAAAQPGTLTALALFIAVQRQEEAEFMGDWTFWRLLDQLALAGEPLIEGLEAAPFQHDAPDLAEPYLKSVVRLTPLGKDVLAGRADWAAFNGIDRWWGGTHLTEDALWRWDFATQRLIASNDSR